MGSKNTLSHETAMHDKESGMQLSEYLRHDGLSLAKLIRNRQVKPSEVLEAAITQVEKVNSPLNAVVHKMYERARKKAVEFEVGTHVA